MMRGAVVYTSDQNAVAQYLPGNYLVVGLDRDENVLIVGEDVAGWTLDDYVIPRLGSGMIHAEEINAQGEKVNA